MRKIAMTAERAEEVINKIYLGLSLRGIFNNDSAEMRKFYEYLTENPELQQQYDRAQTAKAELLVDEIIEIADNEFDPNRARVQVDARKWYASKMRPEKYGERIDVNVTEKVDLTKALRDARERVVLSTCYPVSTLKLEHREIIKQDVDNSTGCKPDAAQDDPTKMDEDIFS